MRVSHPDLGWLANSMSDLERETGSTVLWNVSALRPNAGTQVTAGCSDPQECTLLTPVELTHSVLSNLCVRPAAREERADRNPDAVISVARVGEGFTARPTD